MNNQLGMEMSTYRAREQKGENPSTQERRTYNTGKEKTKCRTKGKHPVQNERKIPSIERKGKHTVIERDVSTT